MAAGADIARPALGLPAQMRASRIPGIPRPLDAAQRRRGPALANAALEPSTAEAAEAEAKEAAITEEAAATNRAILAQLEEIARLLQAQR